MKKNKFIAVDPGSRYMGYASFENRELVDFGVKDICQDSLEVMLKHVETILERMIMEKRPSVLVYEKNQFSEVTQNHRVVRVIQRILTVANRHGLSAVPYSPKTVRKIITGNGNAKKVDAAKAVAAKYPETRHYLRGRTASQEKYFQNALDAAACGMAHLAVAREHSRRAFDRLRKRLSGKR